MNILFENIRIIEPAGGRDEVANLWVKDGVIAYIGADAPQVDESTQRVNAASYVAAPGFFDMHVHFREPGDETKETIASGSAAAANGGFTGALCMPNTNPTVDDVTVVEYIKSKSANQVTDVHISGAITKDRKGEFIVPMLELTDAGALMFTDDGNCVMNSEVMRRAFDYAATRDLLIAQHAEDHPMTKDFAMNESALSYKLGLKGYPAVAEENMIARDLRLAEYCGNRRYHVCHISSKGSVQLVREAKAKGLRVTAEAAPHHFTLNELILDSYNTDLKMNPPLRSQEDVDAIIQGLADGTIDCIASDHAPHPFHEKDVQFEYASYGIVGLETSVGIALTRLYHTGAMELPKVIAALSTNPRRVLGLAQPSLEVGAIANLTILDPNEEWIVNKRNFKSHSNNTPFDGMTLKGKAKYAINNNKMSESTL